MPILMEKEQRENGAQTTYQFSLRATETQNLNLDPCNDPSTIRRGEAG